LTYPTKVNLIGVTQKSRCGLTASPARWTRPLGSALVGMENVSSAEDGAMALTASRMPF
jgi:hypothetical protein